MRDMRRIRNADAVLFRADSPSDERGKRYSLVCRLLRNVRPATFIATLRCKTVSEQVCHRLADALPAIKGKAVTVSSRLLRSLTLAPQPPAHRAGLSPTAPRGHKRPGDALPARPSVPRIRVLYTVILFRQISEKSVSADFGKISFSSFRKLRFGRFQKTLLS